MEEIHPQDLKEELSYKKLIMIDIRNSSDFQKESVKGSINLPLSSFDLQELDKVIKDNEGEKVYFICYKGVSSGHLIQKLESLGYENFVNIQDGIEGCIQAGLS